MVDVKIAGVSVTRVTDTESSQRFTLFLWGDSGVGKTTLAATAPGKKLIIAFDPDAVASIRTRDDILVADLSTLRATQVAQQLKGDDPLSISRILADDPEIETVIVDSVTNAAHLALMYGITQTKGATVERPSPGSYQVRNSLTLSLIRGLLRTTGKYNRHCIFTAHEAAPVTSDDGVVMFITIAIGGQLPNQSSIDFSEVWNLSLTQKGEQRIAIRPVRQRKPMKTRMFQTTGSREFDWRYDPDKGEGDGIETWYNQWKEGGYKKIPVPKAGK